MNGKYPNTKLCHFIQYGHWLIFIDRLWSKIEEETEKLKIDLCVGQSVLMIVLLTEPNVAITPQSRQYWQISATGRTGDWTRLSPHLTRPS